MYSDQLDSETIGKAFLSHICSMNFEPYKVDKNLPIKHQIERIQHHDRRLGNEIAKFWVEATEANIRKKAEEYNLECLNDSAEHDGYGLLKAAARAVKSSSYTEIGTTVTKIYNAYRKERGKRPDNPKVLPSRIKKGLESLI